MVDVEENRVLAERACEWLALWLRRDPHPWDGPAEVIIYARRIVIAIGHGTPIPVTAPETERFRLRIAPTEHPAATLRNERDDGRVVVLPVAYVPPSLDRGEGEPDDD